MLTKELRDAVGKAVYAVQSQKFTEKYGSCVSWEANLEEWREMARLQGEAAIAAFLAVQPVSLEERR